VVHERCLTGRVHDLREDRPGRREASAFSSIIVPTDTPGYLIQRAVPTMGHVGGQHNEVVYDHVRVPRSNLLGKRGEGFAIPP
jgi:alkylation response protein AidB-like acyl-CoA dehydrogenase